MRHLNLILLISAVVLSAGCARIQYKKVPTPTQYAEWTDEDQRRADKMEGVRYYLPRPFLHLKQSTPVAQRVALISFVFNDKTNLYEVRVPRDAPTWVKRALPANFSLSVGQAHAAVTKAAEAGKARVESADTGAPPAEEAPAAEQPAAPERVETPSEVHARTGYISDTDPVTRLGDRMDVVYLPDMEEQFVIKVKAGLGKADIETRLRNGWAAEVFAQRVDNSQLIPYIFDQVERASEVARGVAMSFAPLPIGAPVDEQPAARTESGALSGPDAREFLGKVLLFKLAEVRVAQPGLYPICKPRDILAWMDSTPIINGNDAQDRFEKFLTSARLPWIRPDMVYVPAPPFTVVGFHTTTDLYLMAATDRISVKEAPAPPPPPGQITEDTRRKAKAIEDRLVARFNGTITGDWDTSFQGGAGVEFLSPSFPSAEAAKTALESVKNTVVTLPAGSDGAVTFKVEEKRWQLIVPNILLDALAKAAMQGTWPADGGQS